MAEAIAEVPVALNGVRLYTRRVGHGPPVVVLHGGPGAHHDYLLPQYDHLAEGGRDLLYYDQRGGGRSPVPRDVPVGWREHVADLEALRGYWELDRLTVVGYSWGGLLALLYALEHPDRIARLALVSSAPVTAAWRDEFERRFSARMAEPWIARSRAELAASGLARTDPGNDPVSRHRAHPQSGMGESGELRPAPADPADLPERHRSPLAAAARRVRPHAPRGRARDRGAALHGGHRAGHGACTTRRGHGAVRAGAGRVPASRLSR